MFHTFENMFHFSTQTNEVVSPALKQDAEAILLTAREHEQQNPQELVSLLQPLECLSHGRYQKVFCHSNLSDIAFLAVE